MVFFIISLWMGEAVRGSCEMAFFHFHRIKYEEYVFSVTSGIFQVETPQHSLNVNIWV